MEISVIGTGYVGLVSGTCFAEIGHQVTCVDIDENKIKLLRDGKSPIYEPGLNELLERNIKDEKLSFSTEYASTVDADAVFIAVGTPPGEDGAADLKYIFSAIESVLPEIKEEGIIVIKSTVPVGTAAKVREFLKEKSNKKIYVVSNPEFLKEGAAINDFMKPERIIIGFEEESAGDTISELYDPFVRQGNPIYQMSNLSAEMTKYTANCFLATKISFINEISRLCDITGADIEEVRKGIASDSRIGGKFLYPGPGYGGSCFPKDVQALVHTAKQNGMSLKIIEAVEKVNEEQKSYIVTKVKKHFDGDLTNRKIALWGVAFKANTDDIRETPAIKTIEELTKLGADVFYYDPVASDNFEEYCQESGLKATRVNDMYEVLDGADAMVTITEWREFQTPDFSKLKSLLKSPILFDARNLFKTKKVQDLGFTYYAIGKKVN
jgi:UDPglucose 6-dehydrogenase